MADFKQGDLQSAKTLNDLVELAHRGRVRSVHNGALHQLPSGIVISPLPPEEFDGQGRDFTRQTFIGQIRFTGPNGELDFEDARYWIREVWETTGPGVEQSEPTEWRVNVNEEVPDARIRWAVATNLAEILPEDRDNESHGLGLAADTDDGAFVDVSQLLAAGGMPKFFFNRSSGGGIAFCVIVELPSRAAQTLSIKWVVPKTVDNTFLFEKVGEPELVMIWPGQRGRHFRGLEVDRSVGFVVAGDNVLAAYQVGGRWYVKQAFQETTISPSPIVNASDCQPHGALQ